MSVRSHSQAITTDPIKPLLEKLDTLSVEEKDKNNLEHQKNLVIAVANCGLAFFEIIKENYLELNFPAVIKINQQAIEALNVVFNRSQEFACMTYKQEIAKNLMVFHILLVKIYSSLNKSDECKLQRQELLKFKDKSIFSDQEFTSLVVAYSKEPLIQEGQTSLQSASPLKSKKFTLKDFLLEPKTEFYQSGNILREIKNEELESKQKEQQEKDVLLKEIAAKAPPDIDAIEKSYDAVKTLKQNIEEQLKEGKDLGLANDYKKRLTSIEEPLDAEFKALRSRANTLRTTKSRLSGSSIPKKLGRIKNLKKSKIDFEAFDPMKSKVQNSINGAKEALDILKHEIAQTITASLRKKIDSLNVTDLTQEMIDLQDQIECIFKDFAQYFLFLENNAIKDLVNIKNQKNQCENLKIKFKDICHPTGHKISEQKKECSLVNLDLQGLREAYVAGQRECNEKQKNIGELVQLKDSLECLQSNTHKGQQTLLQNGINKLKESRKGLVLKWQERVSSIAALVTKIENLTQGKELLFDQHDREIVAKIKKHQENVLFFQPKIKALNEKLDGFRKKIDSQPGSLTAWKDICAEFQVCHAEQTQAHEDLCAELAVLENLKNQLQHYSDIILEKLKQAEMKAKETEKLAKEREIKEAAIENERQEKIKKFYGRIGDLGFFSFQRCQFLLDWPKNTVRSASANADVQQTLILPGLDNSDPEYPDAAPLILPSKMI